MQYRVVWIERNVREEIIEAESEDEAVREWESAVWTDRDDLFYVEDEDGNQTIYN